MFYSAKYDYQEVIGAMTRLLICGSRKMSNRMADYAVRAVNRASELGWTLVVGDAEGIDLMAITQAFWSSMAVECYGITPQPRVRNNFDLCPMENYRYFQFGANYLQRDRRMAWVCDRALCIWNGESRGTLFTHKCVLGYNKSSHLICMTIREGEELWKWPTNRK